MILCLVFLTDKDESAEIFHAFFLLVFPFFFTYHSNLEGRGFFSDTKVKGVSN